MRTLYLAASLSPCTVSDQDQCSVSLHKISRRSAMSGSSDSACVCHPLLGRTQLYLRLCVRAKADKISCLFPAPGTDHAHCIRTFYLSSGNRRGHSIKHIRSRFRHHSRGNGCISQCHRLSEKGLGDSIQLRIFIFHCEIAHLRIIANCFATDGQPGSAQRTAEH